MKIRIEASTQEEYEGKVEDLIKSLRGVPEIRRSIYRAQNEIADHWDKEFRDMINGLKDDIAIILNQK